MDPLTELLKSVNLPIAAALGIIVTLLLEKCLSSLLNRARIFWWKNPIHKWDTDRAIPLMTFGVGAIYGWFLGKGPGHADNIQMAVLYGAAVLGISRLIHKTLLGSKPANNGGGGTT